MKTEPNIFQSCLSAAFLLSLVLRVPIAMTYWPCEWIHRNLFTWWILSMRKGVPVNCCLQVCARLCWLEQSHREAPGTMKTTTQVSNSLRACHKTQAFFYDLENYCYALSREKLLNARWFSWTLCESADTASLLSHWFQSHLPYK